VVQLELFLEEVPVDKVQMEVGRVALRLQQKAMGVMETHQEEEEEEPLFQIIPTIMEEMVPLGRLV
jgi:hypothetical protein